MIVTVLLLLVGLALLLGGGEALVGGASALARRLGLTPTTVGLTVVAFGTSAPELVTSGLAAWRGDGGIAFGNVSGSNMANVSLLLGATALLAPLSVQRSVVAREIPLMILASLVVLVISVDTALGGAAPDVLGRGDGLVLLLLFGIVLYGLCGDLARARSARLEAELQVDIEAVTLAGAGAPAAADAPSGGASGEALPGLGRATLLVVAGLAGLVLGGHLLVGSASTLAEAAGVPSLVVGATVVAVGTSLPELVTSLLAARRGSADLAVGNLVGSNLFNLLFVLGTTATVADVPVPAGGVVDLLVMTGTALLVLPLARSGGFTITRREGAVLVAVYVGYIGWQVARLV